jgi:ABC-type uncharacterized transport system permease subunit
MEKRISSPILVVLLVIQVAILLWQISSLPVHWSALLVVVGAITGVVIYVYEYNRNPEIFVWKDDSNLRDRIEVLVGLCVLLWPLVVYAVTDRDFTTENFVFFFSCFSVLVSFDLIRRQLDH